MLSIRVVGVGSSAVALAMLALSACASTGTEGSVDSGGASVASAPAPATVTHTVHARTSAKSKPAEPASNPKHTRKAKQHRAVAGDWVVPNEVGNGLQDAQDDVQRASGDPVFVSHSHDLLGDRFQILDSDWRVCTQNVAPGTKVGPTAHIDFGVVKLNESCP